MSNQRIHSNNGGFTIVELMIATAVFSVILLLCTMGLLEIGRSYYKGATSSRTQEVARTVLDSVTESIKFNGSEVFGSENGGWYCIGTKRYSFNLTRQFMNNDTTHGLVSDTPGASCNGGTGALGINGALGTGATEMLGARMRLSRLNIEPASSVEGLYNVTVRIITADDDLIRDRDGNGSINVFDNPLECKPDRSSSQFCAVSELTTTAQRRL